MEKISRSPGSTNILAIFLLKWQFLLYISYRVDYSNIHRPIYQYRPVISATAVMKEVPYDYSDINTLWSLKWNRFHFLLKFFSFTGEMGHIASKGPLRIVVFPLLGFSRVRWLQSTVHDFNNIERSLCPIAWLCQDLCILTFYASTGSFEWSWWNRF